MGRLLLIIQNILALEAEWLYMALRIKSKLFSLGFL